MEYKLTRVNSWHKDPVCPEYLVFNMRQIKYLHEISLTLDLNLHCISYMWYSFQFLVCIHQHLNLHCISYTWCYFEFLVCIYQYSLLRRTLHTELSIQYNMHCQAIFSDVLLAQNIYTCNGMWTAIHNLKSLSKSVNKHFVEKKA